MAEALQKHNSLAQIDGYTEGAKQSKVRNAYPLAKYNVVFEDCDPIEREVNSENMVGVELTFTIQDGDFEGQPITKRWLPSDKADPKNQGKQVCEWASTLTGEKPTDYIAALTALAGAVGWSGVIEIKEYSGNKYPLIVG